MRKLNKNFNCKMVSVELMACTCGAICSCGNSCPCPDIMNYAALDHNVLYSGVMSKNNTTVRNSNSIYGR